MLQTIASPSQMHRQTIHAVHTFPVVFLHDVLAADNCTLSDILRTAGPGPHRCIAYVDSGLAAARPELSLGLQRYAAAHAGVMKLACPPRTIVGGEAAKDGWKHVHRVLSDLQEFGIDRQSFVLVFGGGAVLDTVGLGAALCHRGVRLIRFPSTTLSQDDAGVGIKNGINLDGVKNFIGTFAPPFAVINDLGLLRSLSPSLALDGIAEAFKIAIIKDEDFFAFLERRAPLLGGGDWSAVEEAVQRCAALHLDHIRTGGDPFETGSTRPLDFGHWSAHRLEGMSGYTIRHGQAVAIGIALDSYYALRTGHLTRGQFKRIIGAFRSAGLPTYDPLLAKRTAAGELEILAGLEQFREHLGGELTIALPDGLGRKVEVHAMDTELIAAGVEVLGRITAIGASARCVA